MKIWAIISPMEFQVSFENIRWDIAEKRMSTLCLDGEFLMFFEKLKVMFFDKNGICLPSMKANWKLSCDGQKVEVLLFINREKAFRNSHIEVARICQIKAENVFTEVADNVFKGHPNQGILKVKILDPKIYGRACGYKRSNRADKAKSKFNIIKHILSIFK